MSKIRTIYLYLVCLVTLFMAIGGFIGGVSYLAQSFFPTSYSSIYFDDYDYGYDKADSDNEKVRNLKYSITSFALLVVSAPIFMYHWKKIEDERKELEVQ